MIEEKRKQTLIIIDMIQKAGHYTKEQFAEKMLRALKNGADPYVQFEYPSGSGSYISGIEVAISLQNKQAVEILLSHANNNKIRVGLERPVRFFSEKSITNKSILQLARVDCPQSIFDLLFDQAEYESRVYGAATPENILKNVINYKTLDKDGVYSDDYKTTLGEELAFAITSRTLFSNLDLNLDEDLYTEKELDILYSALDEWKTYHNDGLNEPKFRKEFAKLGNKGISFLWSLNHMVINDMIDNNLLSITGRSSVDNINFSNLILAFSEDGDVKDKNKILEKLLRRNAQNGIPIQIQQLEDCKEKFPSTTSSSGSSTSRDADYVIVNMPLKNFFEEEPINVNVKIFFSDLTEILQERIKNRRPSLENLKSITQSLVKNESESSEGMNRAAKETLNELSEGNTEVIDFYNNLRALIKTEVSKMTTEKRKYFVENNVNIKASLTAIQAITFAADLGLAAATSGASTALGSPVSMLMSPMSVPLKRAADKKAEAVFDITVNEVHAEEKIAIRIASAIAANMITTIQEVNPEEIKSLSKKVKAKAVVSFSNLKKGEDPLLQVVKYSHISIDQYRKKRNCLGM